MVSDGFVKSKCAEDDCQVCFKKCSFFVDFNGEDFDNLLYYGPQMAYKEVRID